MLYFKRIHVKFSVSFWSGLSVLCCISRGYMLNSECQFLVRVKGIMLYLGGFSSSEVLVLGYT